MVGVTVVLSWAGLATLCACLSYISWRLCDCSRASYFPVRRLLHQGGTGGAGAGGGGGYLRLTKSPPTSLPLPPDEEL